MAEGTWDRIAGKWKQLRGDVRTRWGELTDDEIDMVAGQRDKFVGKIQERYGIARDEAERQVNEWSDRFNEVDDTRTFNR